MNADQLRRLCLGMPGAFEDFPFGPETSVLKVRAVSTAGAPAKMFAAFREDSIPLTVSLKCDPTLAEQLRAAHPEIIPGYHLNKKHWNTVDCTGGLPEELIRDLIEDSYDLVVSGLPKSQQEALEWRGLVARGTESQ
ncbi:MmcQ/YjbR family DNA-binding protein [Psychromicrobium xiongbiense]|uniref:MmcQ/YjbR family DNA-binding protein n=1 Tax=Psychromicrobium xiongbiense TaxID=3051184 RepID=UPI002552A206|nr:MmcQ/YjbR family DNA-binding protein [Psychromicrobium sp. YIM S02556]